MRNSKSEHIKELIRIVHSVGLGKCSFECYMNSDVKLLESKENRDIKKVPLLLEEIKKEHGLAFTIKDTKKVSPMKLGELTINVPTGLKIQRSMNMEPVA